MSNIVPRDFDEAKPVKTILLSKENLEIIRAYKAYVEIESKGFWSKKPVALRISIPMNNPKKIFDDLKDLDEKEVFGK